MLACILHILNVVSRLSSNWRELDFIIWPSKEINHANKDNNIFLNSIIKPFFSHNYTATTSKTDFKKNMS